MNEILEKKSDEKFREELANLCHEQWSDWMEYLFSKCDSTMPNILSVLDNDSLIIPAELVKRWKRQMELPYLELSESEQDNDRTEADKFLSLLDDNWIKDLTFDFGNDYSSVTEQ